MGKIPATAKDLIDLERMVIELSNKVAAQGALIKKLENQVRITRLIYSGQGLQPFSSEEYEVKEVIEQLLKHFDLQLNKLPATAESIILETINVDDTEPGS